MGLDVGRICIPGSATSTLDGWRAFASSSSIPGVFRRRRRAVRRAYGTGRQMGRRSATRDTAETVRVFTIASKTRESVGTGVFPRWLPDGRRLVAQDRGRITLVDDT